MNYLFSDSFITWHAVWTRRGFAKKKHLNRHLLFCNPFFSLRRAKSSFLYCHTLVCYNEREEVCVCVCVLGEREWEWVCKKSAALIENEPFLRKASHPSSIARQNWSSYWSPPIPPPSQSYKRNVVVEIPNWF